MVKTRTNSRLADGAKEGSADWFNDHRLLYNCQRHEKLLNLRLGRVLNKPKKESTHGQKIEKGILFKGYQLQLFYVQTIVFLSHYPSCLNVWVKYYFFLECSIVSETHIVCVHILTNRDLFPKPAMYCAP